MSPEEVGLLQYIGEVLLYYISNIVTMAVLYGLYLVILAFGIRALLKRNSWNRYTWTLSGFLLVLFLISTINLATFVATTVSLIRGAFIDNANLPLTDRLRLANKQGKGLDIAGKWAGDGSGGGFLFTVADAVVVWRACVLWSGNKLVKVLLLALLLVSCGSGIASAALDTVSKLSGNEMVLTSSPSGIMLSLAQSLSLTTNVAATILIGYKAYYHRNMMKTHMGLVRGSRSGAILLFLTESGVAFCVLQVIAIATEVPNNTMLSTLDFASLKWQSITAFAAAAYPVLVLIIVDNHRSISDHAGGSVANSGVGQGSNGVASRLSFSVPSPGISSQASGGAIPTESMIVSRINLAASADHSIDSEGSIRFQDLEKGKGLTADAFPYGGIVEER